MDIRLLRISNSIILFSLLSSSIAIQECNAPNGKDKGSGEVDSSSKDTVLQEEQEKSSGEKETRSDEDGQGASEEGKNAVVPSPSQTRRAVVNKEYSSVEERKKSFFEHLYPIVRKSNERILEERDQVLTFFESFKREDDSLEADQVTRLKALGVKYRVKPSKLPSEEGFKELKRKVDAIPEELALVQAANESNWGRSRFAKEGNNLFGEWCFTEGCGIVPKRRSAGSKHEVAAFTNVELSVRSYMRNLNSHPAYKKLRDIRSQRRREGKEPKASELAVGLSKYAGIGNEYVRILRSMLKKNSELLDAASPVRPVFSEDQASPIPTWNGGETG